MQLLTILILVTLPIIFVQFLSPRLSVLMSEGEITSPTIEALYEKGISPETNAIDQQLREDAAGKVDVAFQGDALFLLYDEVEDSQDGVKPSKLISDDLGIEDAVTESVNQKKVRLVKGKQHVQGMEFLSVILMLKEKQR